MTNNVFLLFENVIILNKEKPFIPLPGLVCYPFWLIFSLGRAYLNWLIFTLHMQMRSACLLGNWTRLSWRKASFQSATRLTFGILSRYKITDEILSLLPFCKDALLVHVIFTFSDVNGSTYFLERLHRSLQCQQAQVMPDTCLLAPIYQEHVVVELPRVSRYEVGAVLRIRIGNVLRIRIKVPKKRCANNQSFERLA
jgi:hypothetical protein